MEIDFIHVCEMAFATKHSNNINIIGIFEHINASNFPVAYPRFVVAVGIRGDVGPHRRKFRVYKKDEREPLIETNETGFEIGEIGRHYLVNNFVGVVFPEPGDYEVEVVIDDHPLVTRASFSVRQG